MISGLLSISTGSHTFQDETEANILAIIGEKFVFIIPGTATTPLALLEFVLDAQCECLIDEETSQDFRPHIGRNITVLIETGGRGYQLFRGVKNALDSARLVVPEFEQGEAFVRHASQNLQLMPILPRRGDSPTDVGTSSRAESRGFRRLDVGMIDMSTDSDAEDGTVSASDAISIVEADAHINQCEISRSQSRLSSRTIETKLKEAHRNKHSESASFVPQSSLILGEQGELASQHRSIDPRMLMKREGDNVQVDVTAGLDMDVDFATYLEQIRNRGEDEAGRSNAKRLLPSLEPCRSTILRKHVESSPSDRAHRMISKRPAAERFGAINSRSLRQTLKSQQSFAQGPNANEDSEHSKPLPLRNADAGLEPSNVVYSALAATGLKPDTQPDKHRTTLQRNQKSQPVTSHPMDWDVGDMADERIALPTAKKPRLTKSATEPATRKSQERAQIQEESIRIDDTGVASMLKRPKPTDSKSQRSQQIGSKAKQDEFDIEDEDEIVAPAPKMAKGTTKRATNAARKKNKFESSKPTKGVSAQPTAKGRKALPPMSSNTSLASTRARRGQLESKRYFDDSASKLENLNLHAQDVTQKATEVVVGRKQTPLAKVDVQKLAVSVSRHREDAEIASRATDKKQSDEARSDLEMTIIPPMPVHKFMETAEVVSAHETLVTASPTCRNKASVAFGKSDNAFDLEGAEKGRTRPQEAITGAGGDHLQDETVEDSYPMASAKSQGPRVSFGSKLGQMIQNNTPYEMKASTVAARTTPLPKAKSFVSSVNETRSASPKKKPRQATTAKDSDEGAELPQGVEISMERKEKTMGDEIAAPIAQTKKLTAVPSRQNAKITIGNSNGELGSRNVAQQKLLAEVQEADDSEELLIEQKAVVPTHRTLPRRASLSKTGSVAQPRAGADEAASEQEVIRTLRDNDQSHANREGVQPQHMNVTIDLTQVLDDIRSVTGRDRFEHMQDGVRGIENEAPVKLNATGDQDNDEIPLDRQDDQAVRQSPQVTPNKPHATENGTLAKTPQSTKVANAERFSLGEKLTASKNDASILTNTATKKVQLVHFGKHGPQNQGIPSPDKQTRKSAAGASASPETPKHLAYKQRQLIAAVPNLYVNAPRLQADFTNPVGEVDYDDRGILVENDTVMEDVGETAQKDHEHAPFEERAPVLAPHLPSERVKMDRSASQSSRVDQNGSPRLHHQHHVLPTLLEISGMGMTTVMANDYNSIEEEDPATSTEESASASTESAYEDSDPSFHVIREATVPFQHDQTVRTRTQVPTAIASSPKTVKQAKQKPAAAAIKVKQGPRESLGLSKIVQEQYPQAQTNVTTRTFRNSALKTAISQALDVSPTTPLVNCQIPVKASNARRQPLKEMSNNSRIAAAAQESSTSRGTEPLSAAPCRVRKPQSVPPLGPHPISDALNSTPVSLRTNLLAKQSDKNIKKEDTILESLIRGKSVRQYAESADRTLVEGNREHPCYHQRPSEASSVSSLSLPPEVEHGVGSHEDDRLWSRGSREAHRSIHDALLEITNVCRDTFQQI